MTQDVVLHVVRKGALAKNALPAEWRDPEQLLALDSRTRRLLIDNPLSQSEDDPVQASEWARRHVCSGKDEIVTAWLARANGLERENSQ